MKMLSYLIKLFVLFFFSLLIMFFYYIKFNHLENFDWYFYYIPFLAIWYWIYKYFSLKDFSEKVYFTPFKIFIYFLLHLYILSSLFFVFAEETSISTAFLSSGFILFFKILYFSILPILLCIVFLSFWKKILSLILSDFSIKDDKYKFLFWMNIWFFSFLFLLAILGFLGFYNLISVFSILVIFLVFSYKEFLWTFSSIFSYKIEFDNHKLLSKNILDRLNSKLLTTEFLFIIITLVLSVNLISVFRPFPIWWDDLWAYMNFPKLMAASWSLSEFGSMMTWQTFTWIWYLFNSPTLAFYLNNVWWFLSVISITLIISLLFKNSKKTFINLPLLASAIFISMPMVVFEQAKDMKIDPALFFVSISALYFIFDIYNKKQKEEEIVQSEKNLLKKFLLIWILLWLAFTIKFTSLILISAVVWILFFTRLWIFGFLWFLWIYLSIFTAWWFWSYLNVVSFSTTESKLYFSAFSFVLWAFSLVYARMKLQKRFRIFIPRLTSLLIWVIIAILPWAGFNIYNAKEVSIWNLLWGKAEIFNVDYSKIYTKEELEKIENKSSLSLSVSNTGTTTNEDFGRYFGYEEGINNYIKLPWNLTMQVNQKWEFTDIWFLFLALLPTLLLFLPFRKNHYSIWVYGVILFEILLFIIPETRDFFTLLMSNIWLPFWYIFVLLVFILPLTFFSLSLENRNSTNLFKINLVFACFYTFLWTISAFWVVWYWIVMYFSFILMIIFWIYYLSAYENNDSIFEKNLKFSGSFVIFFIIFIYITFSVIPHSFSNLKAASYSEYKLWKVSVAEAPFLYHREYLKILFDLNIAQDKQKEFLDTFLWWKELKNLIIKNSLNSDISTLVWAMRQIISEEKIPQNIRLDSRKTLNEIYSNIQNPNSHFKSSAWIYRIWTFLKYNISDNHKRLMEDSLVSVFDKYIYDENPDIAVERIHKLWIDYFLVDLNAATIDKDPRHDLTRRYENLLKTFTSSKLELVETDSVCLKMALENYSKDKNIENFVFSAGVNYDSYTSSWETINRGKKLLDCYSKILDSVKNNKISDSHYPFLKQYVSYINELETDEQKVNFINSYLWQGYKVLFRIK